MHKSIRRKIEIFSNFYMLMVNLVEVDALSDYCRGRPWVIVVAFTLCSLSDLRSAINTTLAPSNQISADSRAQSEAEEHGVLNPVSTNSYESFIFTSEGKDKVIFILRKEKVEGWFDKAVKVVPIMLSAFAFGLSLYLAWKIQTRDSKRRLVAAKLEVVKMQIETFVKGASLPVSKQSFPHGNEVIWNRLRDQLKSKCNDVELKSILDSLAKEWHELEKEVARLNKKW